MLSAMVHDDRTAAKLGEGGLAAVAAWLWPGDCQTCGRPLGGQPPALCIDDSATFAAASLHHQRCRRAAWNDDSVIFLAGGAPNLTWRSLSFGLPLTVGGEASTMAVLLVNPGLEMIFLEPEGETWRPVYGVPFDAIGLAPPGRKLRVERPVRELAAWASPDLISVTVKAPPEPIYEANASPDVVACARERGGVLLMITHAMNPAGALADPQAAQLALMGIIRDGEAVCGFAAFRE